MKNWVGVNDYWALIIIIDNKKYKAILFIIVGHQSVTIMKLIKQEVCHLQLLMHIIICERAGGYIYITVICSRQNIANKN